MKVSIGCSLAVIFFLSQQNFVHGCFIFLPGICWKPKVRSPVLVATDILRSHSVTMGISGFDILRQHSFFSVRCHFSFLSNSQHSESCIRNRDIFNTDMHVSLHLMKINMCNMYIFIYCALLCLFIVLATQYIYQC